MAPELPEPDPPDELGLVELDDVVEDVGLPELDPPELGE